MSKKRIKSRKSFITLPPYIIEFKDYIIKKRHNSKQTASDVASRLYKIHTWLLENKKYKKKYKSNWDTVKGIPIVNVDIEDMTVFFNDQYQITSANTRLAYKSAWNLFMVYAEITLKIENPIPDRHWKFIIVGKKNGKDKTKSELILNDDNITKIIRSAYTLTPSPARQRNALILRTLIETGGRISEILRLNQSSVCSNDGDTKIILHNTKTIQHRNPTRIVPISEDLYKALQIYFNILRTEQRKYSLAFPTKNGEVLNQNYYRVTCIQHIAKDLELKGLHPHLFRHYRISTWCETAITESDIARIAYMAGDTIATIRNVYLHIK